MDALTLVNAIQLKTRMYMDKLKKLDFLGILLAAITVRSLLEINISQALVFLGLIGFAGFMKWRLDNKKVPVTEEMKKDLETVKANISGLMIKNASKPEVRPTINW